MKVSQEATDLCPRDLCEDASGESAVARDRALASDLGLVYLHVIAPDGIERDLPWVSDTLGNFGADTGSTKTRRIRASLDRKISLFGGHGESPRLFGIGPPSGADRADGQLDATCALQRGHR
jgi:hypothetical protein